jgi:hypothetical protein
MKNLFNDLSQSEKNRILEQYNNSLIIETKRFNQLMKSQLGDVRPLINEQNFKDELIKQGYKDITSWYLSDVGVVYIPDGEYIGEGTQDYVFIKTPKGVDTGYVLFWKEPINTRGSVRIVIGKNGAYIGVNGKFNSLMLNETKLNSSGLSTKTQGVNNNTQGSTPTIFDKQYFMTNPKGTIQYQNLTYPLIEKINDIAIKYPDRDFLKYLKKNNVGGRGFSGGVHNYEYSETTNDMSGGQLPGISIKSNDGQLIGTYIFK